MIRVLASASLIAGLIAGSATSAHAQLIGQMVGGVTSAADQQIFLGGSLGVRAGFIEIDGEVGRMRDILPKGLFDAFNEFQEELGLPVRARARLTNTYVSANLRIIPPTGGVRPFVAGGVGLAHLEPKFEISVLGIELGDVFGLGNAGAVNKMMVTLGGGLSFEVGERTALDLGYRYVTIPDTDYTGFNVSSVPVKANVFYVAFGARF